MSNVMNAKDTVSAKLAQCYVTIDGNRYNFMQAISLVANIEKTKKQVPILGRSAMGNKASGWKGSGKATFHYNTSIFRKLWLGYNKTGKDIYFDIMITNEDPASDAGAQTIILVDCNINNGVLAKFDANEDYLDEEMEFTFEDFKMPEEFNALEGM